MVSQDVIAFLRSRPIAMLCTRDAKNRPYLHESYLAQTEADHVVVLVAQQFGRMLVENVNDNGLASLLISRAPGDHRSVQLKGRITRLEMPEVRAELFGPLFPLIDAYRMFMTEEGAQDGTPNVTSISQVWYVDPTHVAVSFQFFSKTVENLKSNPQASIRLFDPDGIHHWSIDAIFVREETDGPLFDAMELQLEAIASMTGMEGVFKLKGAHIYEVLSIERIALVSS